MRRVLVVLALGGCLVLAGCASGGPDPTASPTTEDPAPTTSPESSAPNGSLEVHFINVGQSSAILVVGPTGETMLVDSGDFKDDGQDVLAYLERHEIERIDYLVTSHNDADHIGGHATVIEYYETEADGVGAVYDPGIAASTQTYEAYLDAVERHDVSLFRTLDGDTIPMEGVAVEVLGPPQPYLEDGARNENSIVLSVTFGETTILLPGDAEDDQEQYLIDEHGDRLDADVLQASHHGSSSSSSGPFLDAADPSVVVVSSAYDSRYGHPNEETLRRLADRSVPTYWTATHGDVELVSDGRRITVRTQRAAPTDPLALRSGAPVDPGTDDPVSERAVIVDGRLESSSDPAATTAPTTVADGGSSLVLEAVNADAAGDDRENLEDEYVVLENAGNDSIDLGGWTLSDESGKTYTFPEGVVLDPGATVTVHTGNGTDDAPDLYWDAGRPVWNNDGDTITVKTPGGDVALEVQY